MRTTLRQDEVVAYKRMVQTLRERSLVTEPQARQLTTYGYLRNALAHWERTDDGAAIADPRQTTVDEFADLAARVMRPRLAMQAIGEQQVMSLDERQTIDDFLTIVREHDFSQVPVLRNGSFVDVLTVGAVVRWLSAKNWPGREDGFRRARVSYVPLDKFLDNPFLVRDSDLTAPEALALFEPDSTRPGIAGIVVTRQEANSTRVLAMILPWDIPALIAAT